MSAAATKGGVGKTTLIANVSAVLADIGLRVLMIDCDVQPSLSKYYPISHRAPNGIVELLLGENTEEIIRSTISNTVFPNLDIVISNNITGTQELLKRLQKGEAMRIPMPQLRAIIYAQDRTNDAKFIASSIKDFFSNTLDDRRKLLSVAVPAAKAYKEATTLRVPVHCHERKQLGKMLPAYEIMHRIVYEIFPGIEQKNLRGSCFNDMASLLQKEVQS
ncbi:TPA: ParA family protein [Neisseria gonorrhoeae]